MVLFGCHETANPLNKDSGGYENVSVLELIRRPSVISLPAKLDQVEVREREGTLPEDQFTILVGSSRGERERGHAPELHPAAG